MSDLLVRGLPREIHRELQRMAEEEDTSVNQILIRSITNAVRYYQQKRDEEEERREAFRRLDEIRERLRQKYGQFDDSTKIIREFRDGRNQ